MIEKHNTITTLYYVVKYLTIFFYRLCMCNYYIKQISITTNGVPLILGEIVLFGVRMIEKTVKRESEKMFT